MPSHVAFPGRVLVLWCPDWPVTAAAAAAGVSPHVPAAVFAGNRVVTCSAVARRNGVRRGMLRREAQSRCPDVAVLASDPARDARLFEPVVAAAEELVPGVDVVRPGVVAVPVRGAAAYFGGRNSPDAAEHAFSERLAEQVSATAGVECQVGIADGLFAALLAARRGVLVPEGRDAEFLAPLPVAELDQQGESTTEFVDLLRRLGLRTLGRLAELDERTVATRFGHEGVLAHRIARGAAERPLSPRRPAQELAVEQHCDPPLERVDTAAFVARTLADRLHAGLTAQDLACTRVGIYARTEEGEERHRVWRSARPVTAHGVADRVRWQFESWLQAGSGGRPSSGVVHLRLVPEELVHGAALQLHLWHGAGAAGGTEDDPGTERASRAFTRVQALLGPEGVCTPVLTGGRGPAERVEFVSWGSSPGKPGEQAPWPGRLPAPSPTTVPARPVPAAVLDDERRPVSLTARGALTSRPHSVAVEDGVARNITGWAGPWPVDERWWDSAAEGRRARIQVVTTGDGPALLLLLREHGKPRWIVEGVYD
ncbi:DNA polymerase Y family protein [Haloechinothrix aidingensis]|uniref:DNA polymerase Y family protein n=1 Tax=Haloechinothrix aidingensis TaxID=2752311 RepID=UPI0031B58506